MNYYEQMIVEDTGCPPREAFKVEAVMRQDVFHSTLAWQTRGEFRRGARKAWRLLNENREDYEEESRQCRVAMELPAETAPSDESASVAGLADVAPAMTEHRSLILEQKQTVLNLVVFREDQGESIKQGCRFHLAPCDDGRWFAWAEAHQPPNDPEPCDAICEFYNGVGKAFGSRAQALAAAYDFGAELCHQELESLDEESEVAARQ